MKPALNVVDRFTLAYNVIVPVVILVFQATIPDWPLRLLPNVGMTGDPHPRKEEQER